MKRNTDPPTVLSRLHCNIGRQRPHPQQTLLSIVIRGGGKDGKDGGWGYICRSLAAYAGLVSECEAKEYSVNRRIKPGPLVCPPHRKTAQLPSHQPYSPLCDDEMMECCFAVAFHRCDWDPEGSRRNNFGSRLDRIDTLALYLLVADIHSACTLFVVIMFR